MASVVRQDWVESERGWGVRPDGYTLHLTSADRDLFVKGFYDMHNNLPSAPDEYTRTNGGPTVVDVDDDTVAELQTHRTKIPRGGYEYSRYGIWKR